MTQPCVCLTIAGSDPSGGAGIQGDLKTFAAHNVYGMAVIAALTAQNTRAVTGVVGVDAAFVTSQLQAIYEDIPATYVKTGMLLNADIVNAVADFFIKRRDVQLIVDPVMISSSGSELLQADAVHAYIDRLFPLATLLTPNHLETRHLCGMDVRSVEDAVKAAELIRAMGASSVLIKGGDCHFAESKDILYDVLNHSGELYVFERQWVGSGNTHGTGCAMAAAICCGLSGGTSLPAAVDSAGQYVGNAIRYSYRTGQGSGAINHLWNIRSKPAAEFDDNSR